MLHNPRFVSESVTPSDCLMLSKLAEGKAAEIDAAQIPRLCAMGWVDAIGDTYLITIAGRTVIEGNAKPN